MSHLAGCHYPVPMHTASLGKLSHADREEFPCKSGRRGGVLSGLMAGMGDGADLKRILQAVGLVLVLLLSGAAVAQQSSEAPALSLPTVEVVGATPLLGSGVDRDKVPAETQ